MRVAVTRRQLPGDGLERLERVARSVRWQGARPPTPAEIVALARDADALICMASERIDEEVLSACPRLRVVANLAAGLDNLDVAALTRRGIPAGNTPGVVVEATADHAWALIAAACRRVVAADRLVRSGGWTSFEFDVLLGQDLHGATLGVVGYGGIGRAVARRAGGFGMTVLHHSRSVVSDARSTWTSLADLMARSDVVTVHVPLNASTRHLIGKRELALMKPTAVFVNTSRGAVVDQRALTQALGEGRIFGAGLDVYETEPLALDDPLLSLERCVLSPHIGSASVRTRARMVVMAVDNVIAGLEGRHLPYCVNPEVYERSGGLDSRR